MGIKLKTAINPEKFSSREQKIVSESLRIPEVRPEISREVQIKVVGKPFSSPDSVVQEQVELFGGKIKGTPVLETYRDGPWRGQYNGDRRYTVDFSAQTQPMGTFHILDGTRCRIAYPGNIQTCARCHNHPKACPGNGMARECEKQEGQRRSLSDLKRVWAKLSGEDPNLDDSFNVIVQQIVSQSEKNPESGVLTAKEDPPGATNLSQECSLPKGFPKEQGTQWTPGLRLQATKMVTNLYHLVHHHHHSLQRGKMEENHLKVWRIVLRMYPL